jgi:hypothetical protein
MLVAFLQFVRAAAPRLSDHCNVKTAFSDATIYGARRKRLTKFLANSQNSDFAILVPISMGYLQSPHGEVKYAAALTTNNHPQ